jgi:hypothetical protein
LPQVRKRLLLILLAIAGACSDTEPEQPVQRSQPTQRDIGPQQADMLRDAQLRNEVTALGRRLRRDPAFSDLWIEWQPRYRVVVAFADSRPREDLLASVSPALREVLEIRTASRTRAEIGRGMDAIIAALKPTGIDYTAAYSPKAQRFEVTVGAPAAVETVRARLPAGISADTDVRVGSLPVQLTPQDLTR